MALPAQWTQALKYTLSLAAAVGIMVWLYGKTDFSATWEMLSHASLFWALLSFLASLVAFTSRARRWQLLLQQMNYKPDLFSTFNAMMVGYIFNYIFPRLGEVTRCGVLQRTHAIPVESSLGTVVAERVIDLITLFMVLVLAFIIEFDKLFGYVQEALARGNEGGGVSSTLIYVLIALLAVGILALVVIIRTHSMWAATPWGAKVMTLLQGLWKGISSVWLLERKGEFIFHSLLIWVMYFCMIWFLILAIPETSHLSAGASLALLFVGSLGMAAPTQGGVGTYHAAVTAGLLLYGIADAPAANFALLSHTLQSLEVFIIGGISVLFAAVMLNKKKDHAAQPSKNI